MYSNSEAKDMKTPAIEMTLELLIKELKEHPWDSFKALTKYLTTWSFILVLFHKWTHTKLHLLFLTFIVACGGLFVSNVDPRAAYYTLGDKEYVIYRGWLSLLMDVVCHVGPFVFVCVYYGTYYTGCSRTLDTLINTLLLILIYFLSHDMFWDYRMDCRNNVYVHALLVVATVIFIGRSCF